MNDDDDFIFIIVANYCVFVLAVFLMSLMLSFF